MAGKVSSSAYPIPHPQVAGRVVNGEAVLVLPGKGQVKVLNEVGARIWELADGNRTVAEIVDCIDTEFDVARPVAEADTCAFIERLAAMGILELAEQPRSSHG